MDLYGHLIDHNLCAAAARLGDISGTHEGDSESSVDGADLKGGAGQVERWRRLGESNPDLRITSRKHCVHQEISPRGLVRRHVSASMMVQCAGCSCGCSTSNPAERLEGANLLQDSVVLRRGIPQLAAVRLGCSWLAVTAP
jgi:hypothetical protein